jgi:DTW domain-containing protein YfiP
LVSYGPSLRANGRGYRLVRCDSCGLVPIACACAQLPRVENRTRVIVVAHARELQKPSNTGRLAVTMLSNARLVTHGGMSEVDGRRAAASLEDLDSNCAWLLFPRADARPLHELLAEQSAPTELVVPDGTWSQTRRLVRRHAALQRLRAVTISEGTSEYLLRRGTVPGFLCTLEAVARSLGALENPELARQLLTGFRHWQRAALAVRGRLGLLGELPLDPAPGL